MQQVATRNEWVTPRLEQISMAETATKNPSMGSERFNQGPAGTPSVS